MITLSICMIVKNEEDVLARCLDCIKNIADEIVIVDTGSTDRTKEIAIEYTDKVFDFEWCEDFAAARNFSFSKSTMEYTMWLDADDVIDDENIELLNQLKNTLSPDVDVVMMKYDVAFDEHNNPTLSYYRERIFKTSSGFKWVGEIHEVIPQCGNIEYREISIKHKKIHPNPPGRNLKIFEKMIADKKTLDPRQKYYYARELYYNNRLNEAIKQFNEFLDEGNGWIENNIGACKDLASCYFIILNEKKALESLFRSFIFDVPRAEICCDIGKHFMEKGQYAIAIYWYERAASCDLDERNCGFCLPDCYGYLPYIQLCVCYDRLGNTEKAIEYNEKAGAIKPDDKCYLFNKEYFSKI